MIQAKDINATGTGLSSKDPAVAAKLAAAIEAAKKEAEQRLKKGGSKVCAQQQGGQHADERSID